MSIIPDLARDIGINEGTLGNWVNADRRRRDGDDGQLSKDKRAELARLRYVAKGPSCLDKVHTVSPRIKRDWS